jgi:hypothetical protein
VPQDSGRWWHALVPTTNALLWAILGVITGTVFGWVLIGILYLAVGLTSGDWSFHADLLRVWAAVVAISVVAGLRNLVDE